MKTESSIREKIEQLQGFLTIDEKVPVAYHEILNGQIRALKWVLGEKVPIVYFCTFCGITHPKVTCPTCGNDNILVVDQPK